VGPQIASGKRRAKQARTGQPVEKMVLWEILGATGSASAVESRLFQHGQSQCHTFSTGWQEDGLFPGGFDFALGLD